MEQPHRLSHNTKTHTSETHISESVVSKKEFMSVRSWFIVGVREQVNIRWRQPSRLATAISGPLDRATANCEMRWSDKV